MPCDHCTLSMHCCLLAGCADLYTGFASDSASVTVQAATLHAQASRDTSSMLRAQAGEQCKCSCMARTGFANTG